MSTKVRENYLKALYHLHLKDDNISLTELGKNLGLSKPTVNDMIKKLYEEGWVIYERYKPIKLTEEGRSKAALVVRRHRLSEMFLSQIMGFGWEEVHDIAEELEHIKTIKFFDRMDELLGFPSSDPHGSPIPSKEGEVERCDYTQLSECSAGTTVVLKALRDSSTEFLLFLNRNKIQLGIEIKVHQIELFDKSLTVSYGEFASKTLSEAVCQRLLVKKL